MRCPQCGARNTADAPWCTQCLTPLAAAEDATPVPAPDPGGEPDSDRPAPAPTTPTASAEGGDDRDFRTVEGEVEWRCRDCGQWNPLLAPTCTVCGSSLPGADRSGTWSREQVARTRRVLWLVAGVICLLALVGVVVALVSVRAAG